MSFIRKCNLDTYKNLPIHDSNCNFRFFHSGTHTRLHMDQLFKKKINPAREPDCVGIGSSSDESASIN